MVSGVIIIAHKSRYIDTWHPQPVSIRAAQCTAETRGRGPLCARAALLVGDIAANLYLHGRLTTPKSIKIYYKLKLQNHLCCGSDIFYCCNIYRHNFLYSEIRSQYPVLHTIESILSFPLKRACYNQPIRVAQPKHDLSTDSIAAHYSKTFYILLNVTCTPTTDVGISLHLYIFVISWTSFLIYKNRFILLDIL